MYNIIANKKKCKISMIFLEFPPGSEFHDCILLLLLLLLSFPSLFEVDTLLQPVLLETKGTYSMIIVLSYFWPNWYSF